MRDGRGGGEVGEEGGGGQAHVDERGAHDAAMGQAPLLHWQGISYIS